MTYYAIQDRRGSDVTRTRAFREAAEYRRQLYREFGAEMVRAAINRRQQ